MSARRCGLGWFTRVVLDADMDPPADTATRLLEALLDPPPLTGSRVCLDCPALISPRLERCKTCRARHEPQAKTPIIPWPLGRGLDHGHG